MVVAEPDQAEPIAQDVIHRFDELAPSLYEAEEAARGYVEAEDRQGQLRRFPLLSISIGVATTRSRTFGHRAEAVEVATEMKNFAKRTPGSWVEVDRRTGS